MILDSWPEHMLEKYIGAFESGKNKQGGKPKSRGGARSKNRPMKDGNLGSSTGFKSGEAVDTLDEFFKILLSDAANECRQNSKQAFLTFMEIWPEEAQEMISKNQSVYSKHKEIIESIGSEINGKSTYSKSSKLGERSDMRGHRGDMRNTHKASETNQGFLSPKMGDSRRADAPKSQNRAKPKNKILVEEPHSPEEIKVGGNKHYSPGFNNQRPINANDNREQQSVYLSKYKNHDDQQQEKNRSVSKDADESYKMVNEKTKKVAHKEDFVQLDEKCLDISEIEIDPEEGKQQTLYPKPYKTYSPSSKKTPEQEIFDLIKKAESENYLDRSNAFEQLANYISNKASSLPNVSMFCKIVNLHFDHLDDKNSKVILVVHKSFGKLIHSFGETLEPYLSEIIPRLLINLTDKRESVNNSSNILLNSLSQRYGGDKLINYFIALIDVKEDSIVTAASLEVLSDQLIKSTDEYFTDKTNIKKFVKRVGRIIYERSMDKSITMPALG